jgi:hypothetical protein
VRKIACALAVTYDNRQAENQGGSKLPHSKAPSALLHKDLA